jgi:N-ethylmaleimide reductase
MTLKNRIVLAPLTRGRAGETRVPNDLMGEYYQQRSGAGLMITEATVISAQGNGWIDSPGIYTDEMQAGWKKINDRLRLNDTESHLFLQLWHMGRASHSDFHNGDLPVSSSAVKLIGDQIHTPKGKKDYETPRALETAEVKAVVQDYKRAAERAKAAGFSGVEVHSANGYLVNQFLDAKTNLRTDEYGGSLENRYRFLKEILDAILEVFPASQVGVRLSPNGIFNDMGGADFREIYDYVIKELNHYKLGYLHVMDGLAFGFHEQGQPYTLEDVKKNYEGVVMGNCGYNPISASEAISKNQADLIAFGRPFITNPDLPTRIKENLELTPFEDMSKWYGGGAEGYTDYPRANT